MQSDTAMRNNSGCPNQQAIGKHINNALHEELASDPTGANFATIENSKNPTVAKFAIVQKEGGRLVTRQVYYR